MSTTAVYAVRSWTLNHPKPVKTLLECWSELEKYQTEAPDWSGLLNPRTVAATVRAHAEYEAVNRGTEHAGSATATAVSAARNRLSSEIAGAVSKNLGYYTSQVNETFCAAADQYEAAAAKLPREFTSEDVVGFDAETFEAYHSAKDAAVVLASAREFMLKISQIVPGEAFSAAEVSAEFLILDPGSVEMYSAVQSADTRGADPAYRAVNPVLLKAVKDGAVLRLSLPSEATAAVNNFEEQRAGMNPAQWAQVRSSVIGW